MNEDQRYRKVCTKVFEAIDGVPHATNGMVIAAVLNVLANVLDDMSPDSRRRAVEDIKQSIETMSFPEPEGRVH
jgi:hypothetical protein